ncbi:hypothetical protein HXX02_13500 [Microbulbifer elongatus]|uniref:Uncharacterized protein n=1 Tax=Microbulbifer elongatus TaxID=86173 RepID=A0ABT1P2W9_9GAMM|nr:hypothetical protein [Microbulbifer elongatus]MCQ3830460.1 hypothetical protein [Microbulbifer elongatus]
MSGAIDGGQWGWGAGKEPDLTGDQQNVNAGYSAVRDHESSLLNAASEAVNFVPTENNGLTGPPADVYGQDLGTKSDEEDWCSLSELSEQSQVDVSAELDEWRRGLGYDAIGTQNRPNSMNYQDYNLSTLRSLAGQGDFYAIYQLLERPEVTQEERKSLAHEALVYGATTTIAQYAAAPNPELSRLIKAGKPEAAKQLLIEELAWGEYAAIRGDYTVFGTTVRSYQNRLKLFGDAVRLSNEDLKTISAMAHENVESINAERTARGLGELSLSPPKSAKKMFERKVGSILSGGYDLNYGRQFLQANSCVERHLEFFTRLKKSGEAGG